ncbi:MAG: methionyl aminopeptidase [Planctomycetota bacterium]
MSGDGPGRNDPCRCGSGKKYKKCHYEHDVRRNGGPVRLPSARQNSLLLDEEERVAMRRACRFNAEVLDVLRPHIHAGQSTGELDRIVYEYTLDHGHTPACLGYKGYPKTICTSINEVVCHGIPDDREVLKESDIINVDLTTIVDGWFGDQSETFLIGEVPERARQLVQVTFECLHLAIRAITPGCSANEIGRAIAPYAQRHGFSVVQDYQGHGVGRSFHQDPSILHYVNPKLESVRLVPGLCFTIEPMINAGTRYTALDPYDHWTVRTRDGQLSAQFEHTILMTERGPEILTLTRSGPQAGDRIQPSVRPDSISRLMPGA